MMSNLLVLRKPPRACLSMLYWEVKLPFPLSQNVIIVESRALSGLTSPAKLTNKDTQDLLETNISAALTDLKSERYHSSSDQCDVMRRRIVRAAEDNVGFVDKKNKDWFDEIDASVSSILSSLPTLHLEYENGKTSAEKQVPINYPSKLHKPNSVWLERTFLW